MKKNILIYLTLVTIYLFLTSCGVTDSCPNYSTENTLEVNLS